MPIIDVEFVTDSALPDSAELTGKLADAAADIFNTAPGRTWVRTRTLDPHHYAENGGGPPDDVAPVFVTVLKADLPPQDLLRREMQQLAQRFAAICDRPVENIHILYEPSARGRIAFGGDLVE